MKFNKFSVLYKSLLVFIVTVFMSLAMPVLVLGAGSISKSSSGTLFIEALYYSFPFMKVVNNSKIDTLSSGGIKDKLLYMIGINVADPLSVIGREISYLSTDASGGTEASVVSDDEELQPYRLSDGEIAVDSSNNPGSSEGSNNIDDLPDRVVSVYDPNLKKALNASKPEVLIYHTHTSESYLPVKDGFSYDENYSVVGVGDALKSELENNYGISVIHDKTVHDTNYLQSYSKSAITLDKYLKKYKDFKLIIDMHRDGGLNKETVTTKMNSENVAKIMLVTTSSSSRYKKNIALVNKLMDTSNKLFPGFCRGIFNYTHGVNSFNQNKSDNAILIEVGSNTNSADEAKASAKYLARIIGQYINGKN